MLFRSVSTLNDFLHLSSEPLRHETAPTPLTRSNLLIWWIKNFLECMLTYYSHGRRCHSVCASSSPIHSTLLFSDLDCLLLLFLRTLDIHLIYHRNVWRMSVLRSVSLISLRVSIYSELVTDPNVPLPLYICSSESQHPSTQRNSELLLFAGAWFNSQQIKTFFKRLCIIPYRVAWRPELTYLTFLMAKRTMIQKSLGSSACSPCILFFLSAPSRFWSQVSLALKLVLQGRSN